MKITQITHFHGMTRQAFESFKLGQGKVGISPWTCSDNDGMTYLYSMQKLANEYANDDPDYLIEIGIQLAYESASIQAAINSQSEIIILCLNLENETIDSDYSCENMDHIADCINSHVLNISHVVKAYSIKYNQFLAAFTIAGLLNNQYFNAGYIDPMLYIAAKQISKGNINIDEIFHYMDKIEIVI